MINVDPSQGSPHIHQERRENNTDDITATDLATRARGLIDKIAFYFEESVKFPEVEQLVEELGGYTKRERLSTLGWVFNVFGPENEKVSFFMWGRDKQDSRKGFVNPDNFSSFRQMELFLMRVLGRSNYECASIYRIDYAVDIPDWFDFIKKYAYSTRKHLVRVFLNNGHRVNGLQIGGAPQKVIIYDKALEQKIEGPLTRIEVQITDRAERPERFEHLPLLIRPRNGLYYKPFKRVSLDGFQFCDVDSVRDRNELIRYVRLLTLTDEMGVHLARKKCDADGEFLREYSRFVESIPYPIDLDKILIRDLCTFFGFPQIYPAIEEMWSDDGVESGD